MVRLKITDILPLINRKLKIEHFTFVTASKQTITVPPADISFRDFHYLIQVLSYECEMTVGLVENKRVAYTVYDDNDGICLTGQTEQGEKFFVSLKDDFGKRQFIRISNKVEPIEEYHISRIKLALAKVPVPGPR